MESYGQELTQEDVDVLKREEDERNREEDEDDSCSIVPPPDIVAFNEQRSCADIYRMYNEKQLDINPDFQRGVVWTDKAQTLFIDSLMKQLPIPSMCISLDVATQRRWVIDGLQRISSIIRFLDSGKDNDWKLSTTEEIDYRLSGKKVSEIKEFHNDLFTIVQNVTIPITVLRCKFDDKDHMEYLFQIFHRLNTGGNKLYNQEIRNCIYQGKFNDLLKELARSDEWLKFTNLTKLKIDKARFNHEERILRFFAFYDNFDNYDGKLSPFLNQYMASHRQDDDENLKNHKELLLKTLCLANNNNLKDVSKSKNITDAVLVGIAKNIDNLMNKNLKIEELYSKLKQETEFSRESFEGGIGKKEKVIGRIRKAISIFNG